MKTGSNKINAAETKGIWFIIQQNTIEMKFRIEFKDYGQDFLYWTIDTEKEEVVDCQPFQASIWVGHKTKQKAFEVGGEVTFLDKDTGETLAINYPIEAINIIDAD